MSGRIPKKPLILQDAFIITPNNGPYPYSPLQIFGYVITAFFPALSLVVCCLRIHSRRLSNGFGWGIPFSPPSPPFLPSQKISTKLTNPSPH